MTSYDRDEYTSLQAIGDVSALYQALHILVSGVLFFVFRINVKLENHLINGVFRARSPDDSMKTLRLKETFWEWGLL